MKLPGLLVGLSVLAVSANANQEDGWLVPQKDGSFRYWTVEQAEAFEAASASKRKPGGEPIIYKLFTKSNPIEPEIFTTADLPEQNLSSFNQSNPAVFMFHGWMNSKDESGALLQIAHAYLDPDYKDEDYNVFNVDWGYYGDDPNYVGARYNVPKAAQEIAEFIDVMNEKLGLNFKSLTLIGHSLGGQLVGMIGKKVKNGRVDTIYGLDPAGPLFTTSKPANRLASTDAEYVEVIHTNRLELGYAKPLGQADFYPNWGRNQPGCGIDIGGSCSHGRAVAFLIEAIKMRSNNQFVPTKCLDYDSITERRRCSVLVDNGVRMGHRGNHKIASGVYYLPTRASSLFGKGFYYL